VHPFCDFFSLSWEEFVLEHYRHHARIVELRLGERLARRDLPAHHLADLPRAPLLRLLRCHGRITCWRFRRHASTVELQLGVFCWGPVEFQCIVVQCSIGVAYCAALPCCLGGDYWWAATLTAWRPLA